MWLRDGGRCVYCNRDLLEFRRTAYHDQCKEHVLPARKYKIHDWWNLVLSCRECNSLKGQYDPNKTGRPVSELDRDEYILEAKRRVDERRAKLDLRYDVERRAVRDAISELKERVNAKLD